MKQKELSTEDRLFYFQKNFFTLDGLWIVETENEFGFETALKIDIDVWMKLLPIVYRRIMRHLDFENFENLTVDQIIEVLGFRWTAEGWKYEIVKTGKEAGEVMIHECPYKSMMERNPDRRKYIPRICQDVCIPIYVNAVKMMNPEIVLERKLFMGLGDDACNFKFSRSGS
ncbi:MAG: DUF6125 family protein [Promethearchaeota archaeon]